MFKKIAILSLLAIALLANANEEVTVTGEIRMDENITTTTGFESTVKEQVKNVTVISRDDIEKNLGETVVTRKNALNYKYLDDNKTLKNTSKKKLKENINMEENDE